jgi:hypothetical protein
MTVVIHEQFMLDITVFSDSKSRAFENYFDAYGFSCQQIVPALFGTPYCQPSKLLIIPSAFAVRQYYRMLPALEGCRGRIEEFVEKGGVVLAYGAGIDGYKYGWLPGAPEYHHIFKIGDAFRQSEVRLLKSACPEGLTFEPGPRNCDAYFKGFDGEATMALEDDRPVMVHKSLGKGHVIVSGIFDYPDEKFLGRACSQ